MTAENKLAFFLPEDEVEDQGLKLVSASATGSGAVQESEADTLDQNDRKYSRVSMDFFEVAERGLRAPANQNKGQAFKKYIPVLKIGVPILLGLAFLAWF